MPDEIICERCGRTTHDPDKWDPEADTGRIFCDTCWSHRNEPISVCIRCGRRRLGGSGSMCAPCDAQELNDRYNEVLRQRQGRRA